jgi:hypothetical protein
MNLHHTKTKGDLGVLKAQADLCSNTTIALRVNAPRNNQNAHVKFAKDYREVP